MSRHQLTADDRKKATAARAMSSDRKEAAAMRREAELALLDRLHAELLMPEWYPQG